MNALQKSVAGLAAVVLAGVGAVAPARAQEGSVQDAPVQVDMLQLSVGNITTFYAVVRNYDEDQAAIDLRINLPEGVRFLDSYAGIPGENEGAQVGWQMGWINLEVPPGGEPFGPFAVTVESEHNPVCAKAEMYYNTPNVSGTTSSEELCNTMFLTATPGYQGDAE